MYVVEHGNDEKKVLSQLNQECEEEERDQVEEFAVENSIDNWVTPTKEEIVMKIVKVVQVGVLKSKVSVSSSVSYDKIYNIHLSYYDDLEIDLKTIFDDTLYILYEKHLEEKVLADWRVTELDLLFDNRCTVRSKNNNQVESQFCGNTLQEEAFLYDGIEDSCTLSVDVALSIVEGRKKRHFSAT